MWYKSSKLSWYNFPRDKTRWDLIEWYFVKSEKCKWINSLIYDWFSGDGRKGRTVNSHLWRRTREANTCNRWIHPHTLTCISRDDAPFVRPVYKKRNLASRHLDVISFPPAAEKRSSRKRERKSAAEKWPIPFSVFRISRAYHLESVQGNGRGE